VAQPPRPGRPHLSEITLDEHFMPLNQPHRFRATYVSWKTSALNSVGSCFAQLTQLKCSSTVPIILQVDGSSAPCSEYVVVLIIACIVTQGL
jgi:hypothetical protein